MDVATTTRTLALTQRVMPSRAQIARARRRLHRKAAFVAVLTVASYGALVSAPVGFGFHVVAPRLEAACAERGVTYRTHPSLTDAVRSHARWLRTMGRNPNQSPPRQAAIER